MEGDLPTLKDCSGGREKENRSTNLAGHLLWSGENRLGGTLRLVQPALDHTSCSTFTFLRGICMACGEFL